MVRDGKEGRRKGKAISRGRERENEEVHRSTDSVKEANESVSYGHSQNSFCSNSFSQFREAEASLV